MRFDALVARPEITHEFTCGDAIADGVMHHHTDAMQPWLDRADNDPHAAFVLEIDGLPGISGVGPWVPDERRLHVRRKPIRLASMPRDTAAHPRMAAYCLIHRVSQAMLLELSLDPALDEKAHGVPGTRVDEHEVVERRQRFADGGQAQGRLVGGCLGAHGRHDVCDDTLVGRWSRISCKTSLKKAFSPEMGNLTDCGRWEYCGGCSGSAARVPLSFPRDGAFISFENDAYPIHLYLDTHVDDGRERLRASAPSGRLLFPTTRTPI